MPELANIKVGDRRQSGAVSTPQSHGPAFGSRGTSNEFAQGPSWFVRFDDAVNPLGTLMAGDWALVQNYKAMGQRGPSAKPRKGHQRAERVAFQGS
jgi:hypothetical protein